MEASTTDTSISLDQATLDDCSAKALALFEQTQQEINTKSKTTDTATSYPFGGTMTVAGIGYVQLSTVTPMEFTNGFKLTYLGRGGGLVFGAGVYAGAGVFRVDPRSLVGVEVAFLFAGAGGALSVTWLLNGAVIGTGVFAGLSAFAGSGGGTGRFSRV